MLTGDGGRWGVMFRCTGAVQCWKFNDDEVGGGGGRLIVAVCEELHRMAKALSGQRPMPESMRFAPMQRAPIVFP